MQPITQLQDMVNFHLSSIAQLEEESAIPLTLVLRLKQTLKRIEEFALTPLNYSVDHLDIVQNDLIMVENVVLKYLKIKIAKDIVNAKNKLDYDLPDQEFSVNNYGHYFIYKGEKILFNEVKTFEVSQLTQEESGVMVITITLLNSIIIINFKPNESEITKLFNKKLKGTQRSIRRYLKESKVCAY